MPSYPSALWTPDHITAGTVLEASLFTDVEDEIDAIETELGIAIQGTAGSLAERIDLFCDKDGGVRNVKLCDLADSGERRRFRAGVVTIQRDDHTVETNSVRGTYTFSPPLQALKKAPWVHLAIQSLDLDNLSAASIPSIIWAIPGANTITSFDWRVTTGQALPPAAGSSWIMHWFAWEANVSTGVNLP